MVGEVVGEEGWDVEEPSFPIVFLSRRYSKSHDWVGYRRPRCLLGYLGRASGIYVSSAGGKPSVNKLYVELHNSSISRLGYMKME